MSKLVFLLGARNNPGNRARPRTASKIGDPLAFHLLYTLGESLELRGSSLRKVDRKQIAEPFFSKAFRLTTDATPPEAARLAAIRLLALTDFQTAGEILLPLLSPGVSQPVQIAALSALSHFSYSETSAEVIKRWSTLTPRLRSEALNLLIARPERVNLLLSAVESGGILRSELSTAQIQVLCSHPDMNLRRRATELFTRASTGQKQDNINRFLPALQMEGNATHGRSLYLERCASCHRLGGQGNALGPDLVSVKSGGKEKLLLNILDPNREVAPNYLSYVVETTSGEMVLGLIANENASSLTLRRANGDESVVLRSNVKYIRSVGVSVMPEGLEAGLSQQDFADLLEYLSVAE